MLPHYGEQCSTFYAKQLFIRAHSFHKILQWLWNTEEDHMPVSEHLMLMFISNRVDRSISKSMMRTWIEGLPLWHIINDAPWHGVQHWAILSKNTHTCFIQWLLTSQPGWPPKWPLTLPGCLEETLWPLNTCGQYIAALTTLMHWHRSLMIACIAFWCCCRLGELLIEMPLWPESTCFMIYQIMRGTESNELKYIHFNVPCTKTKADGNRIKYCTPHVTAVPPQAFEHHMAANTDIPPNAQFLHSKWLTSHGHPWNEIGSWTTAMRFGLKRAYHQPKAMDSTLVGTTHLLLLSMDPWIVMAQGQWSSQAFWGYWQKCKENLSLFIGFSFQSCNSNLTTMPSFKNHLTGNNY